MPCPYCRMVVFPKILSFIVNPQFLKKKKMLPNVSSCVHLFFRWVWQKGTLQLLLPFCGGSLAGKKVFSQYNKLPTNKKIQDEIVFSSWFCLFNFFFVREKKLTPLPHKKKTCWQILLVEKLLLSFCLTFVGIKSGRTFFSWEFPPPIGQARIFVDPSNALVVEWSQPWLTGHSKQTHASIYYRGGLKINIDFIWDSHDGFFNLCESPWICGNVVCFHAYYQVDLRKIKKNLIACSAPPWRKPHQAP